MPFDKQWDNTWKSSQLSSCWGLNIYIYTLSQFLLLSLSFALLVCLTISPRRCLFLRRLISETKQWTQLPVHLGGCARLFLSVLSFSWANTLCSLPASPAWEMGLKRKGERGKEQHGMRLGVKKKERRKEQCRAMISFPAEQKHLRAKMCFFDLYNLPSSWKKADPTSKY